MHIDISCYLFKDELSDRNGIDRRSNGASNKIQGWEKMLLKNKVRGGFGFCWKNKTVARMNHSNCRTGHLFSKRCGGGMDWE